VVRSGIYTYSETVHIYLWNVKLNGIFFWDIKNGNQIIIQEATGLKYIDYMVGNVGWNRNMNTWVKFMKK
jgi:4-hydroxyphenylpyruvate dioxygenase